MSQDMREKPEKGGQPSHLEGLFDLLWEFFLSPHHPTAGGSPPANVVDGLYAVAVAVDRLTDTLKDVLVRESSS